MSPITVTLKEVANQFQLWRDERSSKFSPIPAHLKDQTHQLLKSYSIRQVAISLKISTSVIYKIQKSHNSSSVNNDRHTPGAKSLDFIPINFTDLNQPQNNKQKNFVPLSNLTCVIKIIKPNGTKLIIHTSEPTNVINTFLCSN